MFKKSLIKILALSTLLFSAALSAHTHLESSAPADGAQLSQSPEALQLHFSKAVRLMHVSLEEKSAGQVKLAFMPGAVAEKDISLPLPALEAGEYTVSWVTLGGDGHKMSGKFSFKLSTEK
ncbi:copper resistance CopC family protein [Microbulbifer hainanensis]|uniref:copper resistance CopC family protein n=1 Tax=Microbulbifer hainanensis TaxID=2735675 RepID=UPI001867EFAE|nr:copper resistance CopC family protein [Microbulbifer hainanensis]